MRTLLEPEEIRYYETAGEIVKKAGIAIRPRIRDGERYLDIAERVENILIDAGAVPAFPCTVAVNEVASHYTPSGGDELVIKRGDLVKLDFGASVEGYIADTAFTAEAGSQEHARLIHATEKALASSVEQIKPGTRIGEIGRAIERTATSEGFHVLKDLLGHSLGRYCLHGGLTIPGYDDGSELKVREDFVRSLREEILELEKRLGVPTKIPPRFP